MKLLPPDTLLPKVYGNTGTPAAGYVELNALLLDARVPQVIEMLLSGNKDEAGAQLDDMADELHLHGGLRLAWAQVVKMWLLADGENHEAAISKGIDTLHTLMAVDNRSGVESLSIVAATIYLLAFAHYKSGENKKAEKEDLTTKTVAELRELAKAKEIKGYSTMKKAELIEALK